MIADDPKKVEQLENHFSDPDFDEWVEEFELEQKLKQQSEELDMPDEDTIQYAATNNNNTLEYDEEFEESLPVGKVSDDWEVLNNE